MISPNPVIGTGLHAVGGASAASCYTPFEKVRKWPWEIFWIVQAVFAWLLLPFVIGYITVPDLFSVLDESPSYPFWTAFIFGAIYGFGGLSFGLAIRNIGYSLTYTIAIGISAVFGTIVPMSINGQLIEHFTGTGGGIVLTGMIISIAGVSLCGKAGFLKEKHLANHTSLNFNMKKGLFLALIAGILSGVWGISLEMGNPISEIAAKHGAGNFEGNAKLIVSSLGCLLTNILWFTTVAFKDGSINLLFCTNKTGRKTYIKNLSLAALTGTLWYTQFFFYGLGHVKMGQFRFASWALHMTMLIFFSYIIGIIMKEWKDVMPKTYYTLITALLILTFSFILISYGSYIGEIAAG
ncbi:MAG: rhamnose:proton symporter [Chlorobi bacterium]|nr:rhamnose:proton symporter [Chlorobiota bacterium]